MSGEELCLRCEHAMKWHFLDSSLTVADPQGCGLMLVSTVSPGSASRCGCVLIRQNIAALSTPRALHYSEGKLPLDQIPPEMLEDLAAIYAFGAKKYAPNQWKAGTDWHEFYGSAFRHMNRWWLGEDQDPESHLPHLAHAIWNLTALLYLQERQLGTDDRDKQTP